MSIRSLAVRTSNFTATQACVEIIAGSRGVRLLGVTYISTTATVQTIGLGRPAAIGVTPTSPVAILSESENPSGLTTVALAWGTSPTAPAAFYRRANLPATVGSSFEWKFSDGLYVPSGATLVLWNIVTSVASDVSLVFDE